MSATFSLWTRSSLVGLVLAIGLLVGVPSAFAAGSTTVGIYPSIFAPPSDVTVQPGGTLTVDIVVNRVDGGVGAVNMSVEIQSGTVADITDVRLRGDPVAQTVVVANDSDSVRISAGPMDTADSGNVTIATLTLTGEAPGTSEISLTVPALDDESGSAYTIADTVEGLIITSAPVIADSGEPATDPDGDGLYEDLDGDGAFTVADVTVFKQNLDAPAIQNNPSLFDFDKDGTITANDVTVLKSAFTGETPTDSPTPSAPDEGSPIRIESITLPQTISRGDSFESEIVVTNTGSRAITPEISYAFENTTVLIKDDEPVAAGEQERFVFSGVTLDMIETSVGETIPPGKYTHSLGLDDGPRRIRSVTVRNRSTATSPRTQTSPTAGPGPSRTAEEPRQRGFFSNSGDDPAFLSNVFNLTVLGFLLSVVGIIHQMLQGR